MKRLWGCCGETLWLGMMGRRMAHSSSSSSFSSSLRLGENSSSFREKIENGPSLEDFLTMPQQQQQQQQQQKEKKNEIPYVQTNHQNHSSTSFFMETYGCQMNVADSEVLNSILLNEGYKKAENCDSADIVFLNTCAIRENAEGKIWRRLRELKSLKTKHKRTTKVGVLGCMAERLKNKLLEEDKLCDLVAGPDSYRDLPRLVSLVEDGNQAINVMLSADETYADIMPVRLNPDSKSAFVSIMRGCNNMCSYCIVPFTRGRERSRPISSILGEIQELYDNGYKEVTVLGQNVNSYHDLSTPSTYQPKRREGFKTFYTPPEGGTSFVELIDRISSRFPEMRVRFTSPHPKDFPEDLFHIISERENVCSGLHIPVQSGSSKVLENMRRGYDRETYVSLIEKARKILPHLKLSSDFLCGFCGETEEDHQETLSLLREIEFDVGFMFAYSLREKTHAHRKLVDDVSPQTKQRRLSEIIELFHGILAKKLLNDVGKTELVLVDSQSTKESTMLTGRTSGNIRIFFPDQTVPFSNLSSFSPSSSSLPSQKIEVGDYVAVQVTASTGKSMKGLPLYRTTLQHYRS